MNERLDALLSARRDGVLDAAERTELDRLLEASDSARRRALDFERVDEQLRALAASSVSGVVAVKRLARGLAELGRRPEVASVRGGPRAAGRRGRRFGWGIAAAVASAVAAVWIASLVLPRRGSESGIDRSDVSGAGIAERRSDGVASEDLAALGIDRPGDLEVIEELELLEFLADRERGAEGPRG
jgi:anti-sigma factor RsiW